MRKVRSFERAQRLTNVEQARSDNALLQAAMTVERFDDGFDRQFAVFGAGPAVIFVPMIKELAFVYAPQIAAFQNQFQTIIYEPRIRLDRYLPVAERVAELNSVIRTLELDKAHIVAWSDTGAVAYEFARNHPDRCLSVAFLSVPARYRLPLPVHLGMQLLARWPMHQLVPALMFRSILAWFMSGPLVRYAEVIEIARALPELPRLFIYSCLPNMIEHRPEPCALPVPSVVVYGDCDPVVRPAQAQAFSSMMGPASMTRFIPRGEHMLPWSNAIATNEVLMTFFDERGQMIKGDAQDF